MRCSCQKTMSSARLKITPDGNAIAESIKIEEFQQGTVIPDLDPLGRWICDLVIRGGHCALTTHQRSMDNHQMASFGALISCSSAYKHSYPHPDWR